MALVLDLKPGEKVLVGEAVITNDAQRTRLHIAGETPILREKDVLQEKDADTPCKRIYFVVQCMYLARDPSVYYDKYFEMVREIQEAAPSTSLFFALINDKIIQGVYYKALKDATELIKYEAELLKKGRAQLEQESGE